MDRRKLIKNATVAGLSGVTLGNAAWAADCLRTPAQATGPFYPEPQLDWEDNDLLRIQGATGNASGRPIALYGQVVEGDECRPVVGAKVEIWQADNNGKYKHSGDTRPVPLDPNFQYFGDAMTNQQGVYYFRTIIPGKYPARTPHIHYRVVTRDGRQLVTQLYFAQYAEFNQQDGIYRELMRRRIADRVTTSLIPERSRGVQYKARFNITLASARRGTPSL